MKKKTILIGDGYWGNIIKPKLIDLTNLIFVANSKNNIDLLLENNRDIDFVFVCTPTDTHYDIVLKCIHNKINVFCEKPFTGDYNKAIELYELADKFGVKIYVDNIFLNRIEFLPHIENHKNSTFFNFEWFKYEEIFKEDLLNTLLYHDIYLLLKITDDNWVVDDKNISDDKLYLKLINKDKVATFFYDRKIKDSKIKRITINDIVIDFSKPKNDPLYESINLLMSESVNFEDNRKVTIDTLKFFNKIK